MESGSEGSGGRDEDKKVRIRLKTDPPKDPRSIKAPANKSAMKKDYDDTNNNQPVRSNEEQSSEGTPTDDPMEQIASPGTVTTERKSQESQEVQPPESSEKDDGKDKQSTEGGNKEENMMADEVMNATKREINKTRASEDDKERADWNESPPSPGKLKAIGDSSREERNSGDDTTSSISKMPSTNRTSGVDPPMDHPALSPSTESELGRTKGENSADPPTNSKALSPIPEQTDSEFRLRDHVEEQASDTFPDAGLEGSDKTLNENDIPVEKEDPSVYSRSSKTELDTKLNEENGEIVTEDLDANKEVKKSSTGSITVRMRQSIEKLLMKDSQSKRGSTESKENTNLDRKRESSLNSDNLKIEEAKKASTEGENSIEDRNSNRNSGANVAAVSVLNNESPPDTPSTKVTIKVRRKTKEEDDGKNENNQSRGIEEEDENTDKRSANISITTNDSSLFIQASKTQTSNEMVEADEDSIETTEEPTMPKQKEPTQNRVYEKNNGITTNDNYNRSENVEEGTINNGKNDPEKRKDSKDEDIPVLLRRTTGSEDLKILRELKDRVQPGQVFIVRGETDSYTVKWAQKRKVLAYKVGSKNTSRFSSVLIETVEELERASARRPNILSQFTHSTEGGPKGSILSTYLAGANTRRNIKDHLIRDAGTNTDHHNEFTAKQNPPDGTFYETEHISQDKETSAGGAEQVQTTTGDAEFQMNSYNYPFLTDYDVNHQREAKK